MSRACSKNLALVSYQSTWRLSLLICFIRKMKSQSPIKRGRILFRMRMMQIRNSQGKDSICYRVFLIVVFKSITNVTSFDWLECYRSSLDGDKFLNTESELATACQEVPVVSWSDLLQMVRWLKTWCFARFGTICII